MARVTRTVSAWGAFGRDPPAPGLPLYVCHPVPARLGRQAYRLVTTVGLNVQEAMGLIVEPDVEFALLDPLVEPSAAEDESAQPMHERALGGADQLGPAFVHVLTQRRRGFAHLTVDHQVDQILGLVGGDLVLDESHLARGLLAALAEIPLVEGEAKLSVFEHEIVARAVVPA